MKLKSHFEILKKELSNSEQTKSSYWEDQFQSFKIDNENNIIDIRKYGFGTLEPNTLVRRLYHNFFQRILFKQKKFSTKWYKLFKEISKTQNKVINLDAFRHICVFEFLDTFIFNEIQIDNICVIGDGRCNFVSPCFKSKIFKKIVSVNLTETLLCDLIILENDDTIIIDDIAVATSENDFDILMNNEKVKIILVPASKSNILYNKKLQMFVNMNSFQEISMKNIQTYFDIIKSNKSYFYCCNREHKELPAGEIIEFEKYPWGNPESIIIDELCPWFQRYYLWKKYPFIFKFDGPHQHRLVKY